MAAYTYLIIPLEKENGFFDRVKSIFEVHCAKTGKPSFHTIGNGFSLDYDGFTFEFSLQTGESVAAEAMEIANSVAKNSTNYEKIKSSSTRIDMWAPKDDFEMDYFNESLFNLELIMGNEPVYAFDPRTGIVFDGTLNPLS